MIEINLEKNKVERQLKLVDTLNFEKDLLDKGNKKIISGESKEEKSNSKSRLFVFKVEEPINLFSLIRPFFTFTFIIGFISAIIALCVHLEINYKGFLNNITDDYNQKVMNYSNCSI